MHRLRLFRLFSVLFALLGLWAGAARALTASEAAAIAVGETDARLEALAKAVANADDRTAAYIQALADDAVKVAGGKVFIVRDGKGTDPLTGQAIAVPADAEDVINALLATGGSTNAVLHFLAIAHAAEGLYSADSNPVMDLMAEEGIAALGRALLAGRRRGRRTLARPLPGAGHRPAVVAQPAALSRPGALPGPGAAHRRLAARAS
mgnify:CR=1 FL=1